MATEGHIDIIGQNGLPLPPIKLTIGELENEKELASMAFQPGSLHHNYSHGQATSGYTGAYKSWLSMRNRCSPKSRHSHPNYVNISVCKEWQSSFENFYRDMGERPAGHTIDRINPDGEYEPGNCRWASDKEQAVNRANTILTEVRGETLCLSDISKLYGIPNTTINRRYRQGVRGEELINPANRNKKRVGSKQATSKLDEEKVTIIKEALRKGESGQSLANKYGVSQPTISDIRRGKTWAHVK